MKIYIITSGEYSDYDIDKVFLEEDKAKEYARLHEKDDRRIEEYENSDDDFVIGKFKIQKYVTVDYTLKGKLTKEDICISISEESTDEYCDIEDFPYKYKRYYYHYWSNEHELSFHTTVDDEFVITDQFEEKYLKICRDYIAKIKSMHEVEGYSYKEIEDMIFN